MARSQRQARAVVVTTLVTLTTNTFLPSTAAEPETNEEATAAKAASKAADALAEAAEAARSRWNESGFGFGVLVAILAVVAVLSIVIKFLLRSNELSKSRKSTSASGGNSPMPERPPPLTDASRAASMTTVEGLGGGTFGDEVSSQIIRRLDREGNLARAKRKYRELKERFSIKAAVDTFKERRRYRWVTAATRHGDGLRSIYAEPPRSNRQIKLGAGPESGGSGRFGVMSSFTQRQVGEMLDEQFQMDEDADLIKCLRKTEIFSWLPDQILRAICARVERIELSAGEKLFDSGEDLPEARFGVVVSGAMRVELPAALANSSSYRFEGSSADIPDAATSAPGMGQQGVFLGRDENVTGLSELLSAILELPVKTVAAATAEEDTTILCITHKNCLGPLFSEFPGLREELLLRILIRLNRITFMSLFRLTGRIIIPKTDAGKRVTNDGPMSDEAILGLVSRELGISRQELTNAVDLADWISEDDNEDDSASISSRSTITPAPLSKTVSSVEMSISLPGQFSLGADDSSLNLLRSTSTHDEREPPSPSGKSTGTPETFSKDEVSPLSLPGSATASQQRRRAHDSRRPLVHIVKLSAGKEVIDVSSEAALYVVIKGGLEVLVGERGNDAKSRREHCFRRGETFGHLSLLTGAWSDWYLGRNSLQSAESVWVRASPTDKETVVARLAQPDYYELIDKFPAIIVKKAESIATHLSDVIRMIDLTTTWRHLVAGESLVEEGETCNELFVVLHGRLRGTRSKKTRMSAFQNVDREYGRGALIGEVSFLTEEPMPESVTALRSTQLAVLPKAAMLAVMAVFPQVVFHMGRTMSRSLMQPFSQTSTARAGMTSSVVAIVPASPSAPVDLFLHTLSATLKTMGSSVETLNSDMVERMAEERKLGVSNVISAPLSPLEQLILLTWLSEAEDTSDIVFYQADPWSEPEPSWWSKLCIAQADLVLYVANAADGPEITPLERKLASVNTNARKELVLLHIDSGRRDMTELPSNTRDWITNRGDLQHHHHIRFHPNRMDAYGRSGYFDVEHFKSDFRRLSRWLIGESVGIVLGGGGARGMAHISVLRCLEEMGIPVDFVAGTSIGAFLGAVYAMKCDTLLLHKLLGKFATSMASVWEKVSDLTLPVVSWFTGGNFNRGIIQFLGATRIEDLWLPYFCMTTDLTDSNEIAHRNGSLWRYVRASMTLVNFMPPVCDVIEEEEQDDDDVEGEEEEEGAGEKNERRHGKDGKDDSTFSSTVDSVTSMLPPNDGSRFQKPDGADGVDDQLGSDEQVQGAQPTSSLRQRRSVAKPNSEQDSAKPEISAWTVDNEAQDETSPGKRGPKKTKKVVHYLCDGGYTNNLPADIMRRYLGPQATVIAIDVQGSWQFAGADYGAELSGWGYLFRWLNPFVETPAIPTSSDIQTQLAYISSVKQGSTGQVDKKVLGSAYTRRYGGLEPSSNPSLRECIDLYLQPPVDDVSTLEFARSAEIQERAYKYARPKVQAWLDDLRRNNASKYRCITWSPVSKSSAARPSRKDKKGSGLRASALTLRRTGSWTQKANVDSLS
ncbi:Lysophospholipase NTE1 [Hondaea fermentalgiana]|uniref:Lysophospholipase NTE1 n=1 Tax=Hondaea fermentalgiana TaxID=2315210 RepID=A0A2R5GIL6_9STRA|nr:Lysophospholipase NTE1 [Hondaea fermentalgiana]|eukprot:GBG30445.1 Lysophospholipase NTE1 [Hondaea fermentalgiana]